MAKAGSAAAKRQRNSWQEPACGREVEGRRTSVAKSHLVLLPRPNAPVKPLLLCSFQGLPWFRCPPGLPLEGEVKTQSWSKIAPSPTAQLLSRKKSHSQLLNAALSPGSFTPGGLCPSCPFTGPAPWLDCRSHHVPGCPANKIWCHDHNAGWEPGTAGESMTGKIH